MSLKWNSLKFGEGFFLGAVSAKTVHDAFCEPVLYPSALAVGSVVIHLACRCFTPQCSFDLGG